MGVDDDAAALAQLETRIAGQLGVRPHARRQDHEVGVQHGVVGELDVEAARGFTQRGSPCVKVHGDPAAAQVRLDRHRELVVDRRQNLVGELDNIDLGTAAPQVLRHLETDVPGSDDDRANRAASLGRGVGEQRIQLRLDLVHVAHAAQHVHPGQVDAGNRRAKRFSAGRERERRSMLLRRLRRRRQASWVYS